ncbi:phosphatase PAP2 family protein [Thermococcus sp.]|uniref:phosphatase PAP2 family protein n=1 Tax=Thermococcus sp. TaxID=35749 RepID=UPI00262F61FF|nr:phosphatase PAP2 family protein [Thermococcus sp.]
MRARLKLLAAFVAVYLSWDAYALAYPLIGRWSVNVLPYFLKLPLTSCHFERSIVEWTVSNGTLHRLMRVIYNTGFSGSMFLTLLLALRDERLSWGLIRRYALTFSILAVSFALFHVYAPHMVYSLPERYAPNNALTPPEFVFPSPHCAVAFVSLMTVWKERGLPAWLLKAYLLLVPVSTVLLGEHWVWDVLGGLAVAALAVLLEKRV